MNLQLTGGGPEIGVVVRDLEPMLHFYRDFLGLPIYRGALLSRHSHRVDALRRGHDQARAVGGRHPAGRRPLVSGTLQGCGTSRSSWTTSRRWRRRSSRRVGVWRTEEGTTRWSTPCSSIPREITSSWRGWTDPVE